MIPFLPKIVKGIEFTFSAKACKFLFNSWHAFYCIFFLLTLYIILKGPLKVKHTKSINPRTPVLLLFHISISDDELIYLTDGPSSSNNETLLWYSSFLKSSVPIDNHGVFLLIC